LNVALFDGRFRNRFAYTYTNTDHDDYDPTRARQQTFDAIGRNHRLEYQGTFAIVRGVDAVFGAENEVSRFRTVAPPASLSIPVPAADRGRAEITSVYGQINAAVLTGLTLTGGVRYDDHNRFGGQTLFSGGGVWALPTGTVIRASYSEGFKAPTLYQLFSIYGNQALRPERARGWEAGVEQRFLDGAITLGGTYFERRTRDRIDFDYCPSATPSLCVIPGTTTPRFGYYANVVRAFAKGVEAVGRVALGERLSLDANYSWIASEDRSPGAVPQQLLRRPRHTANASANYSFADAGPSFGAAVRWSGASFDFDDNFERARLSPYTLVDLRAEYPLSPDVRVFVRAENVLDESYRTIFTYGTLGRSIYAGLRGRF
jgi:vitamin B12 transporter